VQRQNPDLTATAATGIPELTKRSGIIGNHKPLLPLIQQSGHYRQYDTQVETTIAGRPDEIHLVSTMIDNPWYVHALRIDDHTYYRLSQFRLCMTKIDSSTLVDLTGR
jgi:hypothetical protein